MGRIPVSYKEALFLRELPSQKDSSQATKRILQIDPVGEQKKNSNDDVSKPRKVHDKSEWKVSQDAVHRVSLRKAQEKRITTLTDNVSRHVPLRFSASRQH